MPKVDAVAELAGKLLQTLQEMRTQQTGYPPTLNQLTARADPAATAEQVRKALGKKPFADQLLAASKKHLEAPIALTEDLDLLARSPTLLEFTLSQLCTAEKPLAPLTKVVGVVEKTLRPAFQTALEEQVRDNSLPGVAGSQTVKGKPNLFLKRHPPPLSPSTELAGRLVEALRKRKAQGTGYPTTLDELKQEVEPTVKAPLLKQALNQDLLVRHVLRSVPTRTDAPVALVEDRDLLAGSAVLLEYLLGGTTTARKPLATIGHLKLHLTRDLQQLFEGALARQIAEGRLPSTVGLLRREEGTELYLVARAAAAWILGQKVLVALRTSPATAPPTLEQLATLAGGASPELMRKALADKDVKKELLVAIPGEPASPVLRIADRDTFAGSPALLHCLLRMGRSPDTQALPMADLSRKLDRTLRYTFETTLENQLETHHLPAGVGCLKIRKVPHLFLLEELSISSESASSPRFAPEGPLPARNDQSSGAGVGGPAPLPPPAITPTEFERRFAQTFEHLDRQRGSVNLVSLVALRRELGVERGLFDRELQRLRREGRYTLQAAEGRHGLTEEERQAGLVEDGTLLLFVSRRQT
jgi:hypothetical protein